MSSNRGSLKFSHRHSQELGERVSHVVAAPATAAEKTGGSMQCYGELDVQWLRVLSAQTWAGDLGVFFSKRV